MACKTKFTDFLQIKNLRVAGAFKNGKSPGIFLELIIGPLIFPRVYYHAGSGSIHLNTKFIKLKGSYHKILKKVIQAALIDHNQKELDKRAELGHSKGAGNG